MPWNRAAALSGAVAAACLASGAPSSARPAPCASPLLASWPTPGRDDPSRALARGGARALKPGIALAPARGRR